MVSDSRDGIVTFVDCVVILLIGMGILLVGGLCLALLPVFGPGLIGYSVVLLASGNVGGAILAFLGGILCLSATLGAVGGRRR